MVHIALLRRRRPYLLPTILRYPTHEHALANREFSAPLAGVIELDETEFQAVLGPSPVTAITQDRKMIERLLASPLVGWLNLRAIPTNQSQWDQAHEGDRFDHLYSHHGFERALEAIRS